MIAWSVGVWLAVAFLWEPNLRTQYVVGMAVAAIGAGLIMAVSRRWLDSGTPSRTQ